MPKRTAQPRSSTPLTPLKVRASAAGTQRFRDRWAQAFVADYFRATKSGLTVSSIALGTYLGESDADADALYEEAIRHAVRSGINLFDTAINYRCQRSERTIGRALSELIAEGDVKRDEVVLCTKGGYVPLDNAPPASREDYAAYLQREYLDTGLVTRNELVGGGHSIGPAFLANQIERSLQNLQVQSLDYFYIHNPEQQLTAVPPQELRTRLRAAFESLESCVEQGLIGAYGCATWSGFRLPAGSHGHLSVYELAAIAHEVAGDRHHFAIVQLPINLTMSEAVRVSTQRSPRGRLVHVLDAAAELGIDVVASAPLLQGQLTRDLPDQIRELFPGVSDSQRALAFVRTLPILGTAVGMKDTAHMDENLSAVRVA